MDFLHMQCYGVEETIILNNNNNNGVSNVEKSNTEPW
jgi:hypothetical protein